MRWLLRGAAALVVSAAFVWILGSRSPVEHTATVVKEISASQGELFSVLVDFESYPDWLPDVDSIDVSEGSYELTTNGETVEYLIVESKEPELLRTRILTADLPYGGRWEISLVASGAEKTTIRITEYGEVYNAFFRFISRYVIGHTKTMEGFLDALAKRVEQHRAT